MSDSTSPNLERTVRKAFDLGLEKNQGDMFGLLNDCVEAHGPDATTAMCRQVDPERLVFYHPVLENEIGTDGYPYAQGKYRIQSDIYGHHIDGSDIDPDFLDACKAAYDHALIHDCGHVVVRRSDTAAGVLLVHRLEEDTVPQTDGLAVLKERHDLDFEILAWPNNGCSNGFLAVVCLIRDPVLFDRAFDIVCEMNALEGKWRLPEPSLRLP